MKEETKSTVRMSKTGRDEANLYREKMGGIMAYEAIEEHTVFTLGNAVGSAHVPVGHFVVLDEFGRSERVLSPESFHKIYELAKDADCPED